MSNNHGCDQKPEAVTSTRKYHVRILVCASSNSALDEIVLRVLSGGCWNKGCFTSIPLKF